VQLFTVLRKLVCRESYIFLNESERTGPNIFFTVETNFFHIDRPVPFTLADSLNTVNNTCSDETLFVFKLNFRVIARDVEKVET